MEKIHSIEQDMVHLPIDAELASLPVSLIPEEAQRPGMSRRDERALAFHFLYAAEQLDYENSLESIAASFRSEYGVDIPENSFALHMAQGVIEQREHLDAVMVPFLKNWRLERLGCCTRLILRLALWELEQPDAVHQIVINEAIELAKGFAEKDAYRFVNGILDEFVKSRAEKV